LQTSVGLVVETRRDQDFIFLLTDFTEVPEMDVSCLNLVRGGEGWSVEEREGRGRCLVAKMQLEVGDVVFEEVPAVWGPKQHSPLCCLGCCKPLFMADICFCQECGLPICGPSCPSLQSHSAECEMMAGSRDRLVLNSDRDVIQVYYFVTVLRCLWLRGRRDEQWVAVNQLVDNMDMRKDEKIYNFNMTYVVDTLQYFGITDFTQEEIQSVCGIFDSNAYESSSPLRVPCRGLYLAGSLMNSSCLPNTRHYFKTDGSMVVVATRPIYPGGELLTCYTSPRWGTAARRRHLSSTKFFKCDCPRCKDPAECGTFTSGLKCGQDDCQGVVLPKHSCSLRNKDDWSCNRCGQIIMKRKVVTLQNVGLQLVHTRDPGVASLVNILEKLSRWFPPSHCTVTEMKMTAIKEWGDIVPYNDLGDNYVDMKVSYCEDMLEIVEQLEGEKSRSRGLILSELLHTLDELVGRGGDIQDNLKFKIKKFKNEVMEILGEDAGAPININIYQNL